MHDNPTSGLNRYRVGLTLEVEAGSDQLALQVARDAGLSLRSRPQVRAASMDIVAVPLFNSEPFAQLRGQMGFQS